MSSSSQSTVSFSSDDSGSDVFLFKADQTSSAFASGAKVALSDQTLLVQAFRGTVNGRKSAARDWLVDRVEDIIYSDVQRSPLPESLESKSYSGKLRGLMRKLNILRK